MLTNIKRSLEDTTISPKNYRESDKVQIDRDEMINADCEIRASCGRVARIGDIYDARIDQFVTGFNIFTENVSDFIYSEPFLDRTPSWAFTKKLFDKAMALSIDEESLLSILVGLVKPDFGAAKCLDDMVIAEELQSCYVEKIPTKKETIDILNKDIKEVAIQDCYNRGTHVVVGITYGVNAAVTLTCDNTEKENEAKLRMQMSKFIGKLEEIMYDQEEQLWPECHTPLHIFQNQSLESKISNEEKQKFVDKVHLKVYTDVFSSESQFVNSIAEAIKWIQSLRKQAEKSSFLENQMEYCMIPLVLLNKITNLQIERIGTFMSTPFDVKYKMVRLFEKMNEALGSLKKLLDFANANKDSISHGDKKDIKNQFIQFDLLHSKVRQQCASSLVCLRSNKLDAAKIENYVSTFDALPTEIHDFINSYEHLKNKTDFIKKFVADGSTIVTKVIDIENIKIDNYEKEIFFFFFGYKNDHKIPQWSHYVDLFCNLTKSPGNCFHAIVDVDVIPNYVENRGLPSSIRVVKYFEGRESHYQIVDADGIFKVDITHTKA